MLGLRPFGPTLWHPQKISSALRAVVDSFCFASRMQSSMKNAWSRPARSDGQKKFLRFWLQRFRADHTTTQNCFHFFSKTFVGLRPEQQLEKLFLKIFFQKLSSASGRRSNLKNFFKNFFSKTSSASGRKQALASALRAVVHTQAYGPWAEISRQDCIAHSG